MVPRDPSGREGEGRGKWRWSVGDQGDGVRGPWGADRSLLTLRESKFVGPSLGFSDLDPLFDLTKRKLENSKTGWQGRTR